MSTVRAEDPKAFVSAARKAVDRGERVHLHAGEAEFELAGSVAQNLLALFELISVQRGLDVSDLPDELTTGQAAEVLGVTRPTVVSLIDKGELAATRVGTHRRLATAEVLAYLERSRRARRSALDEIVAISDDLGMYDDE